MVARSVQYTNLGGLVGDKKTSQCTFGVVTDWTHIQVASREPYHSYCRYTLIDPSVLVEGTSGATNRGFRLTVFAEKGENLPQVRKMGDIMRLHRVISEKYGPEQRMVATARIDHRGFSFILIDGAPGSSFEAYQSSHGQNNSLVGLEQRTDVNTLRTWYERYNASLDPGQRHQNHDVSHANDQNAVQRHQADQELRGDVVGMENMSYPGGKRDRKLFEDIEGPSQCFDSVCKVFHKAFVDFAGGRMLQLLVWDTTLCSQVTKINLMEFISARYSWERRLGEKGLGILPEHGSVLVVIAKDHSAYEPLLEVQEGQWIILRRVSSKCYYGRIEIEFTSNSSVRILQVFDLEVRNLQERYRQGLLSRISQTGDSPWVPPELLHQRPRVTRIQEAANISYSPLRHCLRGHSGMRFRVAARVVGICPYQLEYACVPVTEGGPFMFAVSFCLEDSTGRLDAYLVKDHAVHFFNDLQPADLRQDVHTRTELGKLFDRLLGIQPGGFQRQAGSRAPIWVDPPWLELCIQKVDDLFIIFSSALV